MLKSNKHISRFSWLLYAVLATFLIYTLISRKQFLERTVDINISDTYYIIGIEYILIPLFIINSLIFFLRERRKKGN
ncbi:hypothetical protein SAMN04488023_11487 [Pedobacter rhizosphaerae]|uniref:Uncharacterized protein n=1 Tax=Pedobacter rhizosphaerae TaxID=390241 RepID=A0A1H9REY6_9SPHI|nr:hypothetical protein SAMN04488023_11487 [Pedobacter rhizosphaerae]